MSDKIAALQNQRRLFQESLRDVAQSMKKCAQLADAFLETLESFSPDASSKVTANGTVAGHASKGKGDPNAEVPIKEGKKRKRNSKPKDPNAPKRPTSSYLIFQNDVRANLKKEHPDLPHGELMSLIAKQWSELSDDVKNIYAKKWEDQKVHYQEAKAAYDARSPEEIAAQNAAREAEQLAKKEAQKAARSNKTKSVAAPPAPAKPPPPAATVARPQPSDYDDSDESDRADSDSEEKIAGTESEVEGTDNTSDASSDEEEQPPPKKQKAVPQVATKTKPSRK